MAVISGSAALIKAATTILKVISKSGIKKAAQAEVKKAGKSVTKKGIKKFAKRKAKDFLGGRKKGEGSTQDVQEQRGGALAVRDSSAAVKFVGG